MTVVFMLKPKKKHMHGKIPYVVVHLLVLKSSMVR